MTKHITLKRYSVLVDTQGLALASLFVQFLSSSKVYGGSIIVPAYHVMSPLPFKLKDL